MASPRKPADNIHADGAVYFCYESASDSFSGILDDNNESSFDDQAIREFVQYSRPELFDRLHGLPFKSTDIPQSFRAQKLFKKFTELQQQRDVKNGIQCTKVIPKDHAYETLESSPQVTNDSRASDEMLQLQMKRHVQLCLLNGHSLVLQKVSLNQCPLTCSSSTCPFNGNVFGGTFYLTLKQDLFPDGYTGLWEVPTESFYCLECLEDIFNGKDKEMIDDAATQTTSATYDGVGHHEILKAAARLYQRYPSNSSGSSEHHNATEHNTNPPPNLDRAFEFRLKKQQEIETTLMEVNKYERIRIRSQEPVDLNASPSLMIERPWYMEAARDRYKKQGLSRYDQVKAARLLHERSFSNPPTPSKSWLADVNTGPTCYCREPDLGEEDMIRCTNEWCSIGWFHLRCTHLKDDPPEDARFMCKNCQEDFGPFEVVSRRLEAVDPFMDNDLLMIDVDKSGGEDDSGGLADDEADTSIEEISPEHHTVQTVPTAPWGMPINLMNSATEVPGSEQDTASPPSTSAPTPQTLTTTHSNTVFSPAPYLDGFTTTNRNPSLTHSTINPNPSPTHSTTLPPPSPQPLFPGSSKTTFTDLAPFITPENLSLLETKCFEMWKYIAPPSRLVREMVRRTAGEDAYDGDDDDDGDGDGDGDRDDGGWRSLLISRFGAGAEKETKLSVMLAHLSR